jgi:hypothetical protein
VVVIRLRIDNGGVSPILKKSSIHAMHNELKKTLFIWLPLCSALYCSSALLSTDIPRLSDHELLSSPVVTIPTHAYQGSKESAFARDSSKSPL